MASSVIHHDLNIIVKNITKTGVVSCFNSQLVRKTFSVITDSLGNAEIAITYHHVLACDVLGHPVIVTTRKNAAEGNMNLVITLHDRNGNLITNESYDVLVTYLDY